MSAKVVFAVTAPQVDALRLLPTIQHDGPLFKTLCLCEHKGLALGVRVPGSFAHSFALTRLGEYLLAYLDGA